MNTQQKGQYAQLKVEQRAIELGITVSVPTVDVRYDLILDDGRRLIRAQVKYVGGKTHGCSGSVVVPLRKWPGDKRTKTRNYGKDEVDVILAYIPEIDDICCLGPELFHGKPSVSIRIAQSKSGQKAGMNFASDLLWKSRE